MGVCTRVLPQPLSSTWLARAQSVLGTGSADGGGAPLRGRGLSTEVLFKLNVLQVYWWSAKSGLLGPCLTSSLLLGTGVHTFPLSSPSQSFILTQCPRHLRRHVPRLSSLGLP